MTQSRPGRGSDARREPATPAPHGVLGARSGCPRHPDAPGCAGGSAVVDEDGATPLATQHRLPGPRRGTPERAKALFQQQVEGPEPRARSQAYAGLAAVALASGDYQRALDFVAQAETANADIGYSHVMRGHIFLNQGKTAEALAAYRTATTKPHTLPWQQAIAYDRLGRLYAAQGDTARALEHYDKAMTQDRDLAVVHANKAYLLDKLGKHQEALELYRQALQLNPHDPLTALLLRDAERRQQLAQDREQQQRIDQLVDELVRAYREDPRPAAPEDDWTSRPLSLAFLPFQHQEALSGRAGQAEFVVLSLTQALRASGRVTVVEREVLDKVLAELKLSAADIVNAPQALRRGKILAARLLATGSLSRFGTMGLLSVRLIKTETTMINAAVSQFVERPDEVVASCSASRKICCTKYAAPIPCRVASFASPHRGKLSWTLARSTGWYPVWCCRSSTVRRRSAPIPR